MVLMPCQAVMAFCRLHAFGVGARQVDSMQGMQDGSVKH